MVIDKNTRGLTLTRPWPYAFTHGPIQYQKRIENRSWIVPRFLRGIPIALHAGKGWDEGDKEFIEDTMRAVIPGRDQHPHSVIFAVCTVKICPGPDDFRIREEQKRWAFGPFCWIIKDLVELIEPVACKGAQGLWTFDKRERELAELQRVYQATISHQKALAQIY
jgi:hypothetical protein